MSTGTDTTAARAASDNTSLADTLISVAALLRRHPEITELYSLNFTPTDYRRQSWSIRLFPTTRTDDDATDAIRTFAGIFGPHATVHLSDPIQDDKGGTYRRIEAHATHSAGHLRMWEHIAQTPAPEAA